jgi:hypothetical protein
MKVAFLQRVVYFSLKYKIFNLVGGKKTIICVHTKTKNTKTEMKKQNIEKNSFS